MPAQQVVQQRTVTARHARRQKHHVAPHFGWVLTVVGNLSAEATLADWAGRDDENNPELKSPSGISRFGIHNIYHSHSFGIIKAPAHG